MQLILRGTLRMRSMTRCLLLCAFVVITRDAARGAEPQSDVRVGAAAVNLHSDETMVRSSLLISTGSKSFLSRKVIGLAM